MGVPLVISLVPTTEQLPGGGKVGLLLDVLVDDFGLHGLIFF